MRRLFGSRALAAIVVAALAAAVYANAVDGAFHFDDSHAVQNNPSIRNARNIPRFFIDPTLFTTLPQNENYRPLLLVSYALTALFTGVAPRPFIAVSLAIHALCAVLIVFAVDRVRRALGRPAPPEGLAPSSVLGGALFAVHPMFSECVNYIHSRSESLAALLTLAALILYLRARESSDERGQVWWSRIAAVCLLLAMCSKVVPGTLPLLLVILEIAAARRDPPLIVARRLIPMAAAVGLFAVLYQKYTSTLSVVARSNFTRLEYFRSELPAILHYLRLFVWPAGLSADAGYPTAASLFQINVLMAFALLSAATLLSFAGVARRVWPGVAFAVLWFLICLAPTSTFFPLAEITNEHRPYLASVAWCALAAEAIVLGLPWAFELSGGAAALVSTGVTAALLISLGAATVVRNRVWHTDEGLWKDVVSKSPTAARAQMGYGLPLMARGAMLEAEPHLREAVRLSPSYSYALINLAQWQLASGEPAPAVRNLDHAILVDPSLHYAHYYRGLAAQRLGAPPHEALRFYEAAVKFSPNFADGLFALALAREAVGDLPGALEAARRAVELRDSFDDRFEMAFLLLRLGNVKDAWPMLSAMSKERPNDPRLLQNIDYAQRLLGSAPK